MFGCKTIVFGARTTGLPLRIKRSRVKIARIFELNVACERLFKCRHRRFRLIKFELRDPKVVAHRSCTLAFVFDDQRSGKVRYHVGKLAITKRTKSSAILIVNQLGPGPLLEFSKHRAFSLA